MRDVEREPSNERIVDFTNLAGRVRVAAITFGIVVLVGAIVEGVVIGLTFRVLAKWAIGYVAAMVLASGVLVALHAYRGADTAQRRGERLAGEDVGLLPPRRGEDR